jgi:hypothetical protein
LERTDRLQREHDPKDDLVEGAAAMQYGILPLNSELATLLALLMILILFAVRTKHKVSFSAAILLAAMAFSIATLGDSERII